MGVADRLLLDVVNRRRLGVDISRAVIGVERTGSMEEKPGLTVTVADPREALWKSDTLTRPVIRGVGTPAAAGLRAIDLQVDGVWYRLNAAAPQGLELVLTFDHRGAVFMSRHDSAMTASRGGTTRAEFVRRQVDEVAKLRGASARLAFWTWKPGRRMPVAVSEDSLSNAAEAGRDPDATRERAKQGKGLRIRGRDVNASQRRNMATALERAERDGAGPKATLALVMACIVEPADPGQGVEGVPFGNPVGGDATSSGILQLLGSHLRGSTSTHGGRRDVDLVCHLFLTEGFTGRGGAIKLAAENPGKSAGWIAQAVQGSAYPDRYDAVRADAERVLDAFGGIRVGAGGGGSYVKPHMFTRPEGEDAWTNTGNLAEEVHARRFITVPARGSDLFVYGFDEDLLRLDSQAVIVPDAPYVIGSFTPSLDYGGAVRSATVTVRASAFDSDFAWGIPVTVEHAGPASGKYLVWDVREVDGSPDVELTLRMPEPGEPEPAAEVVQRSDGSGSASGDGTDVGRVYARAIAIGQQDLPYVWGGGHATAGRPDNGTGRDPGTGYDCSGYVCACLDAGDMLPGHRVLDSTGLMSWGKPGQGKKLTVWANASHTFIEFHGRKWRWADTSRQAGGPAGPHVRRGSRSTAGFVARHPG